MIINTQKLKKKEVLINTLFIFYLLIPFPQRICSSMQLRTLQLSGKGDPDWERYLSQFLVFVGRQSGVVVDTPIHYAFFSGKALHRRQAIFTIILFIYTLLKAAN